MTSPKQLSEILPNFTKHYLRSLRHLPGSVVQLVVWLIADPGVVSLIPARSHTFMQIDCEIFLYAHSLLTADAIRAVVSYKRKYTIRHKLSIA